MAMMGLCVDVLALRGLPLSRGFCSTQFESLDGWDFSATFIWKSKAPTKACLFAWATTKGKIPIEDMLKRRNFSCPSRCCMCSGEGGRICGASPRAL